MMNLIPDGTEKIIFSLRDLYGSYGYSRYKMNKFEEYDLYAHNKDFLISDSVITFTDGNGKLLALKPDVTLSIVKNTADTADSLQKVFYNENVYRIAKGGRNFKEIMQVGLECIGKVDAYCICEVLKLALKSLDTIHPSNVLAVSHLGVLTEALDHAGVPEVKRGEILRYIGEKNLHELTACLSQIGVEENKARIIKYLLAIHGNAADVLPELLGKTCGFISKKTETELSAVLGALKNEKKLIVDFSVVGDINYYNGFVFKGFVEGIPSGVLSGGQYDKLMRKMGRRSGAVGFAVYLDAVEQFFRQSAEYDVDRVLVYSADDDPAEVADAVEGLAGEGNRVLAAISVPENVRYRELYRLQNGRAIK